MVMDIKYSQQRLICTITVSFMNVSFPVLFLVLLLTCAFVTGLTSLPLRGNQSPGSRARRTGATQSKIYLQRMKRPWEIIFKSTTL